MVESSTKMVPMVDVMSDMERQVDELGTEGAEGSETLGILRQEIAALLSVAKGSGLLVPIPGPVTEAPPVFAAVPRSRTLAEEAEAIGGGMGELLAAAAEHPEADRGVTVQRAFCDFGAWVRRQREARGWTLDYLAEKIGSTAAQISLIERGIGKRGPSLDLIARILWGFDVELAFPGADPA